MKKERSLLLIRGLPNSGKTFTANLLCDNCYAADDFFYKNGHYIFDAEFLGVAHERCYSNVKKDMENGVEKIAVHNTLTTEKELKPYFDLAQDFNYKVISLIVEHRHDGEGNSHQVPSHVVEKMRNRFSIKL